MNYSNFGVCQAKFDEGRWQSIFMGTVSPDICYEPARTCLSVETVLVPGGTKPQGGHSSLDSKERRKVDLPLLDGL